MESKETHPLLFFKHNGSTNFSLFFEQKTRGSDFWTIKIYCVDHRKILHSAKDLGVGIGIEFLRVIFIRQCYFKY